MRHTVFAVAVALILAAVAGAGQNERASFDLGLTAKKPQAATGMRVHVLFRDPDDPEGKPPALDGAVIHIPKGLRIDDGAVPRCTASDEEFQARGREACAPETQVGSGAVVVMTGFPGTGPSKLDLVAFNGDGEIVEVVFFEGTNVVAGIDRVTIEKDRLIAHPPNRPGGPPDGRVAIRELELNVARRVENGRAYITTPRGCRAGRWRSRGEFEFGDGATAVVGDTTPCRKRKRRR